MLADPQVIREELQWQRDIDGDKPKSEEFVAEIQQAETVRVFGWMKPGEAFIHLIHSIGKCTSRAAASSLRAKDWGFVNDLTDESTPDLVQLPTVNGWKWPEVKIATDRKEMLAHFQRKWSRGNHFGRRRGM